MQDSVASIQVRGFQDQDLAGVLAAYNQARPGGSAPLDSDRFWAWFDDPDLSPGRDVWVAEADGAILGVVAALPWASHLEEGAIHMLGPSVLPAARQRGVARGLVDQAAAACAQRHPGHRLITRVALPAPGPLAFLAALGFREERCQWALRHDHLGNLPVPVWPEGLSPRRWTAEEDAAPLEALYAEVLDEPEFLRRRLSAEDVRRWHAMGALPAGALQVVVQGEALVGLSLWTRWPGASEAELHFWGVRRAWRRRGLGQALLVHAMRGAHEAGAKSLRMELAASEVPASLQALGFQAVGAEAFLALHLRGGG